MSDAFSRQRLVDLISNFLRALEEALPNTLKVLPSPNYRRYSPFRTTDRDEAAAIVASVKAFLPGDAVLIERAVDRFYGTIDRASISPSADFGYVQGVLNPLRRYGRELATMLTEIRDHFREPIRPAPPGESQAAERPESPPAAVVKGATGAPTPSKKGKRLKTNDLMILELEKNPEAKGWTVTQWEMAIDRGRASIHATDQWQQLEAAKKVAKAERAMRQDKLRGLNKKGIDRRRQGRNLD